MYFLIYCSIPILEVKKLRLTEKLLDQVHKAGKCRAGSPVGDRPATFNLLEIDAYILIRLSITKLRHFPYDK